MKLKRKRGKEKYIIYKKIHYLYNIITCNKKKMYLCILILTILKK